MSKIVFGSARIDERGEGMNGKAGDQTGQEVGRDNYYTFKSRGYWDVCIRIKDLNKRQKYLEFIRWAVDCQHIGYDMIQRKSLYNELKRIGLQNYRQLSKDVECDCSALVSCGLIVAGFDKLSPIMVTATLERGIKNAYPEDFWMTHDASHTRSDKYLRNGDILNKGGNHVVTVIEGNDRDEVKIVKAKAPAKPSWKKNSKGWWYEYSDGSYPKNEWKIINDKWYHFDKYGYMDESKWIGNYYVGSDGAMLSDCVTPDGYTVDSTGKWDGRPKATGVLCYAPYTGNSWRIDEVLRSIGVPESLRGSWTKRKAVAKANGISDYEGTASQNLRLIALAKKGILKRV
ncbi:hypothetical protein B7939_01300 [Eggerthia catenaformis]|nr:hypothetical protein B7939_01300 [Eggerthia catenaformis]